MRNATMPASRQESPRSGGRTTVAKRSELEWETATAGSAALAPRRREPAAPEAQPRLRVAPPAPVTAPRAPFVLLVLCFVVAGVVGILWLNTKINENAFRMQRLQQQQGTLDRQEQRLKQDLAQQEDPGNLAAAARRQGAVPMTNQAFIN